MEPERDLLREGRETGKRICENRRFVKFNKIDDIRGMLLDIST